MGADCADSMKELAAISKEQSKMTPSSAISKERLSPLEEVGGRTHRK